MRRKVLGAGIEGRNGLRDPLRIAGRAAPDWATNLSAEQSRAEQSTKSTGGIGASLVGIIPETCDGIERK